MFDVNDAMTVQTPTASDAADALSVVRTRSSSASLMRRADELHAAMGRAARELLSTLVEIDRSGAWEADGARDMEHWVQMRYGVSSWKAFRWMAAATALEELPCIADALVSGELGLDKVVELTRFATARSEQGLVAWATTVSAGAIRRRADVESRRSAASVAEIDSERRLRWWLTDEGRRMELMAELPAADGALVAAAIERVADTLPDMPGDDRAHTVDARRADALVALCGGAHAERAPSRVARPQARRTRPRIVVHVPVAGLAREVTDRVTGELNVDTAPSLEGGVIDAPTLRRLACDAELQALFEDPRGEALRLGRASREPSAAMVRVVRRRDRECRFPGCGASRFTEAHHVVWWARGGRTDVDNLVLLCGFHHRLVHEHGWAIERSRRGVVRWRRPDGTPFRAGPSPPR